MISGKRPNPNTIHPIAGYDREIYVKPTIKNPHIIVGDFTYIADSEFESHVTHLYIKHYEDILGHESDIENRQTEADCTVSGLIAENKRCIDGFRHAGEPVVLIVDDYENTLKSLLY